MAKPITHTSMRGTVLNMEEMRTRNEAAVAVTGAGSAVPRMNARGDTLKTGGRVDRKREQIEEIYQTQLQGNAKRIDIRAVEPDTFETPQQVVDRLAAATAEFKAAQLAPAAPKPVQAPVTPSSSNEGGLADIIANANENPPPQRTRKFTEKED